MIHRLSALVPFLLVALFFVVGADYDGDTVDDPNDNCTRFANPNQVDTDGDTFGNPCDADFNQDGGQGAADLNLFLDHFLLPVTGPDVEYDLIGEDSIVSAADLQRFKEIFLTPPGPSCCGSIGNQETITPQIVVSNPAQSAVSPFTVCFDATGTTTSDTTIDPVLDLHYSWVFEAAGDPGVSDTWGHGSPAASSKASQDRGVIGCHTYYSLDQDTGWVYTQGTLTVTSTAGTSVTVPLPEIAAAAPNNIWPGTDTVCLSTTAADPNDPDCPSGATRVGGVTDFATSFNASCRNGSYLEGRRCLLKCGESFASASGVSILTNHADGAQEPWMVGSYPAGCATPAAITFTNDGFTIGGFNVEGTYGRIVDLELIGDGNDSGVESGITLHGRGPNGITSDIVMDNLEIHDFWHNVNSLGEQVDQVHPTSVQRRNLSLVNSESYESTFAGTSHGRSLSMTWGYYGFVAGNHMYNAPGHVVRISLYQRSLIAFNQFEPPACSICSLIKMHAPAWRSVSGENFGLNQFASFQHTEYVGVYHNTFISTDATGNHGQSHTAAPQDGLATTDERIRYVHVGANYYDRAAIAGAATVVLLIGEKSIVESNVVDRDGAGHAFEIGAHPASPNKSGVRFVNNTAYSGGSGNFNLLYVNQGAKISGIDCINNACWAPGGTCTIDASSECDTDTNNVALSTASGVFTTEPPTQASHYVPLAAGFIDAGDDSAPAFEDAISAPFVRGAEMEVGALAE